MSVVFFSVRPLKSLKVFLSSKGEARGKEGRGLDYLGQGGIRVWLSLVALWSIRDRFFTTYPGAPTMRRRSL